MAILRATALALAVALLFVQTAAAACSDGYGCTCEQCGAAGYTYYCTSDNECHDTHATCYFDCDGTCVDTSTCHAPDACTASQSSQCGNSSTCCINAATLQPFCTGGASTCCNWQGYYCPEGYACDPPTGRCLPPSPANHTTDECKICEKIAGKLEAKGTCSEVCAFLPPPFDLMCKVVMKAGLCKWILGKLQGGLTPAHICAMLGACSHGASCECGYCMPDFYGNWCLSLPNTCPGSNTSSSTTGAAADSDVLLVGDGVPLTRKPKPTRDEEAARSAGAGRYAWQRMAAAFPGADTLGPFRKWRVPRLLQPGDAQAAAVGHADELCVDGMCDASNAGCCLTCAP